MLLLVGPVLFRIGLVVQLKRTQVNLHEPRPSNGISSSSTPLSSSKKKLVDIDSSYKELMSENSVCYDLINFEEFSQKFLS